MRIRADPDPQHLLKCRFIKRKWYLIRKGSPIVGILEGLSLEGGFTHKERVEDAAQRPHIYLVAVTLLPQYLYRKVTHCNK